MKKTIIIGLISLLLISIVTGIILSNKEEALNYFMTYKLNREDNIEKLVSSIKYTSDKNCQIDYYSEKILCSACFSYSFDDEILEDCISLAEESTIEEDDEKVKEFVRNQIEQYHYTIEKIGYVERDMKDREIIVNSVK